MSAAKTTEREVPIGNGDRRAVIALAALQPTGLSWHWPRWVVRTRPFDRRWDDR
jgi:hypothetical protein